jgi:hypothetical protein
MLEIYDVMWPFLAPETKKSLLGLIALPSLIHLRITAARICELGYLIALLPPSLKQLTLAYYGFGGLEPIEDEGALVERQPCRLEHLTLGSKNPSQFVDWLLGTQSIIDLSNLRTLEAYCTMDDEQDGLMRLVSGLGSSLEHLTFQLSRQDIWRAPFFKFLIIF